MVKEFAHMDYLMSIILLIPLHLVLLLLFFGNVRAISAVGGVIIIVVGLTRVSRDGAFLVWVWMVLVFSFIPYSGINKVSVLVEGVAGSPVGCCSSGWCDVIFWGFQNMIVYLINVVGEMISMMIKYSFKQREFFFNPICSLTVLNQECACIMVKSKLHSALDS